jgi:pimeloyl-ACP methyl ester carboxylesterase
MSPAATLAYTRTGSGEPLVLLHGLGASRQSWTAVVTLLAARFDVIAIDLPGFGDSAPLAADTEPSPAALAVAVATTLNRLGIQSPHVVGNSLGGWVALELAAVTPVRSLTLLSPAGLWREHTPRYCRAILRALRAVTRFAGPVLRVLAGNRAARWVMFGSIVGRPGRMSAAEARQAITDLGRAPGFRAVLRATLARAYVARRPVSAPVSVSFGTRDVVLLPRQSRHLDQLPAHTRVWPLVGTGHVPMADDPRAVAALIERTAQTSNRGPLRALCAPNSPRSVAQAHG